MIPRFGLIIGAMKSGTTSLYEYLAQHPAICRCRGKEPDFFVDEARWGSSRFEPSAAEPCSPAPSASEIENLRAAYEALWPWDPSRHEIALEASTSCTKTPVMPNVAARIAALGLPARFIYVMRDPIERIESHYTHGLAAGWLRPPGGPTLDAHVLAVTSYARQIAEFYQRFPPSDILLVRFEDFVRSPGAVLRRVSAFLGVDPEYAFRGLGRAHNRNLGRPVSDGPLYRAWRRLPLLPALARRLLPERPRAFVRGRLGRRITTVCRLTPEQRAWALEALADDLERLRTEFGVDPSGWNLVP